MQAASRAQIFPAALTRRVLWVARDSQVSGKILRWPQDRQENQDRKGQALKGARELPRCAAI